MHSVRCKLYAMNEGQWAERGTGNLKLNETNKDDGKKGARLRALPLPLLHTGSHTADEDPRAAVMRADATHRLLLNTPLFSAFSIEVHSEKYVRFSAIEGSTPTSYMLRVRCSPFLFRGSAAKLTSALCRRRGTLRRLRRSSRPCRTRSRRSERPSFYHYPKIRFGRPHSPCPVVGVVGDCPPLWNHSFSPLPLVSAHACEGGWRGRACTGRTTADDAVARKSRERETTLNKHNKGKRKTRPRHSTTAGSTRPSRSRRSSSP